MKIIKERKTEYRCKCGTVFSTAEKKPKCPACGKKVQASSHEENGRIRRQMRFRTVVIAVLCILAVVANTILLAVSALGGA